MTWELPADRWRDEDDDPVYRQRSLAAHRDRVARARLAADPYERIRAARPPVAHLNDSSVSATHDQRRWQATQKATRIAKRRRKQLEDLGIDVDAFAA